LAAQILEKLKTDLGKLTLIPGSGGAFEVTVDGDLIYSKLAEGRFPEPDEVLGKL
jgi:selenoprotein W-related protein